MKYTYYPQGTCSQVIEFEIVDGNIHNVQFYGGCDGNTQGVGRLVEGMKADEVVQRLEGIRCGFKSTSCPDQLAKGIRQAMGENRMDSN
ncbi:MAG: TIGR03905 family TSCPD domain-containing protein [Bacteroidales bacterium]|nr:TIGR03905 family TSCPD domain-containing protein [Bacteroidales bacterium]